MGSSEFQGKIWGARPYDWADYAEPTSYPLFEAVLNKTNPRKEIKLLDIGCGSGGFCNAASKRGVNVYGIDASEPLLSIARERVPNGNFRLGEMETLPFENDTFDIVTGFNSFQFASNISNAFKEARRVAKKDAPIVTVVWAAPEKNDASHLFSAISPFMPPPPSSNGKPPLYTEGYLESLASDGGLNHGKAEEISCEWNFDNISNAIRGMLSAGMTTVAIQNGGEKKVREAIEEAIKQFVRDDGSIRMKNTFLCLTSRK